MNKKSVATCLCLLAMSHAAPSFAQTPDGQGTAYVNPCSTAPITDFDFWVGDWVAFDYDTGVVQGIDRIQKTNNGCVLTQDWRQLTDTFRTQGADYRYAGVSFNSVLPDGKWQQVWVGNNGGTIVVHGGLNEDGVMVFVSPDFPTRNGQIAQRTWYWEPEDDGTVHSWGEVRLKDPDGDWGDARIQWNLRYVRRDDVPNLVVADE